MTGTEYDTDFLSFEDIKRAGKVVPFQVVKEMLEHTEPLKLNLVTTDGTGDISFSVPDAWNVDLKALDDSVITSVKMTLRGEEFLLTKRAVLILLKLIGLSDRYAYKAPGHLIEPHINFWFANEGVGSSVDVNVVTKDKYVVSFMGPEQQILSNLEVLEQIRKYLAKEYDVQDLYVDPNIVNNYVETSFRLIFPERGFSVTTVRDEGHEVDHWHYGIHVANSLTGTTPLTIDGFMVEERSLAGILPEFAQTGKYDRSRASDVDDLRGWVRSCVDQIMAILPAEGDIVEHMPTQKLAGKIGALTTDIFRSMKVNRKVQEVALENLTLSGDMTAYGVMHSLAKATAVDSDFPEKIVRHVQKVSGALPHRTEDICDGCGRLHLFD